ncbi:MAG: type II toxin-antitoxin system VapC family toxin [Betaproteobacteria bacterium]
MISVDTNVLARFVLADDAVQHRRAIAALEADEDLFIPVTVLLELAWVLGARDATRAEIASALRRIVGLPRVRAQHPEAVRRALDWMDAGLDSADAFHLALSERSERFLSFDAKLSRSAARLGARPAVTAP